MRGRLSATLTLLSLTLNTVSSVGLSVLEGSPVTLTTTQHEDKETIRDIKWLFNKTLTIVSYLPKHQIVELDDLYKDRVEFDETDFSLTLKNPQRSDSGLYTALVDIRGKAAETAASYELSVLAPVVAPTLTVVSNWSSSDSCDVTLNCTGLNVSLISSCNGTFCSQERGDRFLSIAFNRTTVSCNHSNPVSWRQTTMELEPLCPWYIRHPDNGHHERSTSVNNRLSGIVIGSVIVIVIVIGFVIVYLRKKHKEGEAQIGPNTQDPVQHSGEGERPGRQDNSHEEPTSQAKSNAAPAPVPTVYDEVRFNRHADSSPTEPVMPSSSETLYATVNKKEKNIEAVIIISESITQTIVGLLI